MLKAILNKFKKKKPEPEDFEIKHQEQIDYSMAAMEAALKVLKERADRRKTERPPSGIRGIK